MRVHEKSSRSNMHTAALCAVCALPVLLAGIGSASAHVSEQAFVLLLPTEAYIVGGCLSVLASILIVSFTPSRIVYKLFSPVQLLGIPKPGWLPHAISLVSMILMIWLAYVGFTGTRDPLKNLLPLTLWTGWWIAIVSISGVFGNFWQLINPWSGFCRVILGRVLNAPLVRLPESVGCLPACILFVIFALILVAYPAPSDPDRLAMIVTAYCLMTIAGMAVFGGDVWLKRCEPFTVFFRLISKVSLFGAGEHLRIGFPAWKMALPQEKSLGMGLFALSILAMGSFDGLKETFWWMSIIGVNPLEFPGRTAVIASSTTGLLAVIACLSAAFTFVLWLGLKVADAGGEPVENSSFETIFHAFAVALLPIALGYHISHFLVSLLIDGQHLLNSAVSSLGGLAGMLGLETVHVTSGFIRNATSVKVIWTSQVVAVVTGHVLSVLVSHRIALSLFEVHKRAVLFQIPLSLFMVAYTWFGLWLLATPRGA